MARHASAQGFSALELTLVLGAASLLFAVGLCSWDTRTVDLTAAQQEIRGSLEEAFILARAKGVSVKVALGASNGSGDHVPVRLSPRIKWGKPDHIPMPQDMDAAVAARTGESHPVITVTPLHTTLASAWFLNNGKEALCMRISDHGYVQVLRWRADRQTWTRN